LRKYSDFRLKNYEFKKRNLDFTPIPYPVKELGYAFNISNKNAHGFYESAGAVVREEAFELTGKGETLMVTKHCIKKHIGLCKQENSGLFLVDGYGKKYKLESDCANCRMKILKPKDAPHNR
jgi:hypothetical protein